LGHVDIDVGTESKAETVVGLPLPVEIRLQGWHDRDQRQDAQDLDTSGALGDTSHPSGPASFGGTCDDPSFDISNLELVVDVILGGSHSLESSLRHWEQRNRLGVAGFIVEHLESPRKKWVFSPAFLGRV